MREGKSRLQKFVGNHFNETREFRHSSSKTFLELHVCLRCTSVFDLEVLQLWSRPRNVSQQEFGVRGVQGDRQPLEAKQVVERDGKEGFYAIWAIEALVDVEELVSRSMDENFCLLVFCRHGEVDLGPKAQGGE